jgi:hypothetical protein
MTANVYGMRKWNDKQDVGLCSKLSDGRSVKDTYRLLNQYNAKNSNINTITTIRDWYTSFWNKEILQLRSGLL